MWLAYYTLAYNIYTIYYLCFKIGEVSVSESQREADKLKETAAILGSLLQMLALAGMGQH